MTNVIVAFPLPEGVACQSEAETASHPPGPWRLAKLAVLGFGKKAGYDRTESPWVTALDGNVRNLK